MKKCPCGKTPDRLVISPSSDGPKYACCYGDCCGEWTIEFRNNYGEIDSDETMERARIAWDDAPRGEDARHCRPDYLQWEQRATCCHCAKPLADNQLVKDAYKLNTVNAWAKQQLSILADMAEHREMKWFADEARKIGGRLLHL